MNLFFSLSVSLNFTTQRKKLKMIEPEAQAEGPYYQKPLFDPKDLTDPRYEPAYKIGRTLHLDDFLNCVKESRMIPRQLDCYSFMPEKMYGKEVLWFSTVQDPEEHNWYGNVDMRLDFDYILEHFDYEGYMINYMIDKHGTVISRILLTNESNVNYLPHIAKKVDFRKSGSPIFYNHGTIFVAESIRLNNRYRKHKLEILIVPTNSDCSNFFIKSSDIPVNHSSARVSCNKYKSRQGKVCPYPFSSSTTKEKLQERRESDMPRRSFVSDPVANTLISNRSSTQERNSHWSPPVVNTSISNRSSFQERNSHWSPPVVNTSRSNRSSTQERDSEWSGLETAGFAVAAGAAAVGAFALFSSIFGNNNRRSNN